ncbi:MAG: ABC transporter permease [Betaproteobacteria bacterium]
MRRIRMMVWKELIELRRDPRLFAIVVLAPVLQLLLLGYAATTDIKNVPVVVADADRSRASRDLIARFDASRNFTVIAVVGSVADIDEYLERGTAWMALAIPSGYGEGLAQGQPQRVQVVADGTDSNSTTVALGYATNLVAGYAQELAASTPAAPPPRGLESRVRVWFNPRLESREFMVPGVLALLLLILTSNLAAMAIVREREVGTLEQLRVTPLSRWELVAGKLLPFAGLAMVNVFVVLSVTVWWFEIPLRGSLWLLLALTLLYLISTLALGLFVSTISSTQQQAMMTVVFFFLVPMVYLSGFIFPIENMPAAIQPITYLIPLRYYLVILRSIFLKGVGMDVLWPQALALAVWGLAVLTLAVARSTKRAA